MNSAAARTEDARLKRRRRLLAVLAATLGAVGVLLIADPLSTVDWKEPLRKVYEQFEQHRLAAELQAREQRVQDGTRAIASSSAGSLSLDSLRREAARLRAETGDGDALGRLHIPRLGLDYVVSEGTQASSIRKGPGHYAATSLPGAGGTVGIAAHRGSYLGGPFRHLERLRRGDVVSVEMPYGRFRYAVTATRIVDPAAVGVLRDLADERLVLTTCHPPNSTKRLVVSAVRAGAVRKQEAQG